MSHLYFTVPVNLTSLEEVKGAKPTHAVLLSNSSHELLQDAMGWDKRYWRADDGSGDTMQTYYHTTINDSEPQGVDPDTLRASLDNTNIPDDLKEQADWLYDLADKAEKDGIGIIYIF